MTSQCVMTTEILWRKRSYKARRDEETKIGKGEDEKRGCEEGMLLRVVA